MEKTIHQTIKEAIDRVSLNSVKKDSPQDTLDLIAYELFQAKKYEEAAEAYRFLITAFPLNMRYSMALAACLHQQQQYTQALSTYIMATFIDPSDPMPYYHASDCCIKLNATKTAAEMLKLTIKNSSANPKYAMLKERAELALQRLQQETI